MDYKRFGDKIMVRVDRGEEILESLTRVCEREEIRAGAIYGIGASDELEIGLYNPEEKKYYSKGLKGDFEIAPLSGNVSRKEGQIYLHCHINVCDKEFNSFGGHFSRGVVSGTFEATIFVMDGEFGREIDENIGLNLIRF